MQGILILITFICSFGFAARSIQVPLSPNDGLYWDQDEAIEVSCTINNLSAIPQDISITSYTAGTGSGTNITRNLTSKVINFHLNPNQTYTAFYLGGPNSSILPPNGPPPIVLKIDASSEEGYLSGSCNIFYRLNTWSSASHTSISINGGKPF